MAKIITRVSAEEFNLARLREILSHATNGAIDVGSDLEPGQTLQELVDQVDIACASLLEVANHFESANALLRTDNAFYEMHISRQNERWKPIANAIEDGVTYDEDLDHATADMMDALLASGAAESTDDGEIAFDHPIAMSKEDFKPIVRQAIDSWLRLKATH